MEQEKQNQVEAVEAAVKESLKAGDDMVVESTGYSMPAKEEPKVKRFANYFLAFEYFLKLIYMNRLKNTPYGPAKKQRLWLFDIAYQTLSRAQWIKGVDDTWTVVTAETTLLEGVEPQVRTIFTARELYDTISWGLIDFHARQIVAKASFLSRNKRDFIIEVFQWVDNFVAKEGEEVTMTEEDLKDIDAEKVLEKAKETLVSEKENPEKNYMSEEEKDYGEIQQLYKVLVKEGLSETVAMDWGVCLASKQLKADSINEAVLIYERNFNATDDEVRNFMSEVTHYSLK